MSRPISCVRACEPQSSYDFFLAVFFFVAFFVPLFALAVVVFFLADFLFTKAASQPAAYLRLEPIRKMVIVFFP